MKKMSKLCFTAAITTMLLTGCGFDLEQFSPMDLFEHDKQTSESTLKSQGDKYDFYNKQINKSDNSSKYRFVFKEPKVKKKAEEARPAESVNHVKLYLGDGVYYTIEIPASMDIVTDNSKYIYARNNSVNVSVLSNVPWDEFSNYVSIDDAVSLLPNLIRSAEGRKGSQEAAMHIVNDKAIIIRTYDNPVAFATILNGLMKNTYKVTNFSGMMLPKGANGKLKKLPELTGYHVTVNPGLSDDIQNIYNYKDGTLSIVQELKTWKDAVKALGSKLAVIAGGNVADEFYHTDSICYIEKDDYTVGAVYVNYNTTITLFGSGQEARYNIVAFLKSNIK